MIGVGGYAAGPVCFAAWLTRRKLVILEQNSIPGFTNKLLGKVVRGPAPLVSSWEQQASVTVQGAAGGSIIPVRGKRVNSTNTTATDLVGIY